MGSSDYINKMLGTGIVQPFRRDAKNDFASTTGIGLIKQRIIQIIMTVGGPRRGELPWRQDFGSVIPTLKHKSNNAAIEDMVRVYVVDAITKYEPMVRVRAVEVKRFSPDANVANRTGLSVRVLFDVVNTRDASSGVYADSASAEVVARL